MNAVRETRREIGRTKQSARKTRDGGRDGEIRKGSRGKRV